LKIQKKKEEIKIDKKIGYINDKSEIYIDLDILTSLEGEDIQKNKILKGKVIVIDPGHGGKDPGAMDEIDVAKGDNIKTLEKDLNLKVGLKVKNLLENLGAVVILTRSNDVFLSLKGRTDLANANNADLYLSIHFNADIEAAKGIETFRYTGVKNSLTIKFSENLQRELIKATGFVDRGIKEAGFWVIKHTRMSAALVELGFITNNEEEKIINTIEFQDKVAKALVNAIVDTLN
jgi:N-acetylmuramoyl-L-alanine amidase